MHVAATVPAVEVDDVSFAYRGGPPALEGVTLRVEQGAFVGIAGPNGGGKTTLLRLVLGLERPTSGRVRLFGDESQHMGDFGEHLALRLRVLLDVLLFEAHVARA